LEQALLVDEIAGERQSAATSLERDEEKWAPVFRPHPALEHFPAKRIKVRVEKMRQYKNVELLSDSIGSESALDF
jgi:hypothetical protein